MSKVRCASMRMRRDFHLARLDLGDVEQIVDQAEQMRARGMDVAGIFLVARRADRPEAFLRDDLGKAQDGVERRAQLVAHIGEEGGLGGVRRFGLEALAQRVVARLFEFAREVFHLEAQPQVLVQAVHQPAAVDQKLDREGRNDDGDAEIDQHVAQQKSRRRHHGQRHDARQEHVHVARAADHQHRQHADRRAGQEHVVDGLPGSHSSQGIRPQAALITACIATMRENQGWVRSYSLVSEVSY